MAPERFFIHPSASRDLRSATKWYRDYDHDIAADFVKAVDDASAAIVAAPQRWRVKNRWRRYYLKRFPFTIAYREAGEVIEIGSVMLVVQRQASPPRPRRVWSHDAFEARVDAPCREANPSTTGFGVMRGRATGLSASAR